MLVEGLPSQSAPLSCQTKLWFLSQETQVPKLHFSLRDWQPLYCLEQLHQHLKKWPSFLTQVHPTQLYSWLIQLYFSLSHQTESMGQVK